MKNIVRDEDRGHIISDGFKCNFDYHYECLLTMQNRYVSRIKNMRCSTSTSQKQIYAIMNHKNRDLIGETYVEDNKCSLCQDCTHYHIELEWVITTKMEGCTYKDVTWHWECLQRWYNSNRLEYSQLGQHNQQLQCPNCRGNITGIGRTF
jgi:hypothetical protein